MISKKMEKAINEQINREMYSAYLYLAMAAYAEQTGLKGFANWFRVQNEEETEHAMKFFDYIHEQGGRVELGAIEKPPAEFKSPQALFDQSLKHEQFITKSIGELVDLAVKENDHATRNMLQWYVKEQVEEEANAQEIVTKLKMIGPSGSGLLYLDGKLAKRKAGGEED
jgi:ferritin